MANIRSHWYADWLLRSGAVLGLAAVLGGLWPHTAPAQGEDEQSPRFLLYGTEERDLRLEPTADWRRQRLFTGIGWELGTIGREELEPMIGGYTIIQPSSGKPVVFQHFYVLAAYDLMPRGHLLVAVRDPEYYWKDYDYKQDIQNPIELVWYSDKWTEEESLILDYAPGEYPDDFLLSPHDKVLLVIRKPEVDGQPVREGHSLNIIRLRDGAINDLWLPEADENGAPPADWWPLKMQWSDDGRLLVQAGAQIRLYDIKW